MDWLTDKQFLQWKRRNAQSRILRSIAEALALTIGLMIGCYVLLIVLIDAIPR